MNLFQTLIIIFTAAGLLSGIITVHVKSQIEIAKLQVEIKNINHDLLQKETSILRLEERNNVDHEKLLQKIDKLIERNG